MKKTVGLLIFGLIGIGVGFVLLVTAESLLQEGCRGFPYVVGIAAGLGGGLVLLVAGLLRVFRRK